MHPAHPNGGTASAASFKPSAGNGLLDRLQGFSRYTGPDAHASAVVELSCFAYRITTPWRPDGLRQKRSTVQREEALMECIARCAAADSSPPFATIC
jgi:hypothetical protein